MAGGGTYAGGMRSNADGGAGGGTPNANGGGAGGFALGGGHFGGGTGFARERSLEIALHNLECGNSAGSGLGCSDGTGLRARRAVSGDPTPPATSGPLYLHGPTNLRDAGDGGSGGGLGTGGLEPGRDVAAAVLTGISSSADRRPSSGPPFFSMWSLTRDFVFISFTIASVSEWTSFTWKMRSPWRTTRGSKL